MTLVRWAPTAQRDIGQIATRLVEIDPSLARDTVVAIRASSWRLADYPLSGPAIGVGELRKFTVGRLPYVLVYRVVGGFVEIARVRHAHEDWAPR